jgi:hypothetical protein
MNTTTITRTDSLGGLPVVVRIEQASDVAPMILTVRDAEDDTLVLGAYVEHVSPVILSTVLDDANVLQILHRVSIAVA